MTAPPVLDELIRAPSRSVSFGSAGKDRAALTARSPGQRFRHGVLVKGSLEQVTDGVVARRESVSETEVVEAFDERWLHQQMHQRLVPGLGHFVKSNGDLGYYQFSAYPDYFDDLQYIL